MESEKKYFSSISNSQTGKVRLGILITILAVAVTSAGSAYGYSWYTTDNGNKVRWHRQEIEVVLDHSLRLLGDSEKIELLVIDAFDEWVDEAGLSVEFVFVKGECEKAFVPNGRNENCVRVQEYESTGQDDHGAMTFVTHGYESGEIYDADIMVNSEAGLWRTGNGEGIYSLRAALLHEVGHFLGMAHSDVDEACMAPVIRPDDEAGDDGLYADDINGAAVLYGGSEIADEIVDDTSCSVVRVGAPKLKSGWMDAIAAVFFLIRMTGMSRRKPLNVP